MKMYLELNANMKCSGIIFHNGDPVASVELEGVDILELSEQVKLHDEETISAFVRDIGAGYFAGAIDCDDILDEIDNDEICDYLEKHGFVVAGDED